MSAASAAAEALAAAGVRAAFGVTGSGVSWQIITALEQHGARYFPAAHEAAAAIMAGAFGRQGGALGCSIAIKGPGFANMAAGILSNRYEQWAAISLAEAFDPAQPPVRMHKRLDQRTMAAPLTKAFASSTDPADIAKLASIARAEAPGPVHIDFAGAGQVVSDTRATASDDTRAWDAIRRHVEASRRPIVIAGSLTTRNPVFKRLSELRVPVFTTVAAKGIVDERLRSAAGVFTGDGRVLAPESSVLTACDLVVGFGVRTSELLSPTPFSVPFVSLDVSGDDATGRGLDAAWRLTRASDAQLLDAIDLIGAKSWGLDEVEQALSRMRSTLLGAGFLPARLFDAIQALEGNTTLVVDTGLFCTVAEHLWRARHWTQFVASANGRFMGTAIPMAIGQAAARPAERTVCVMGDGGVRPFWSEIALAIHDRLPIMFVLMTDGRYGSVASAASTPGLTPRAVEMPQPSWFRAAEALGCPAVQVRSLEAFSDAIGGWRPSNGPFFVETPFDADAYAAMAVNLR